MKKVAIVGVEGSGKTVMLAGLGELYSQPDAQGYFLAPKNFETANYVADKIERMRKGEWPSATAGDELQGLDWTLKRKTGEGRRPESVCEVSFLDFAGEVYRVAFGVSKKPELADEAESLRAYIRNADDVIVLINLSDIITYGLADTRVREAMWITNGILEFALDNKNGRKVPRAAIVLSQADSYADTIAACGGVRGVLKKHLPHVANNYDWLDLMAANAVDRTVIDDEGNAVPAPGFKTTGLQPIMDWIIDAPGLARSRPAASARPARETGRATAPRVPADAGDGRVEVRPAPKCGWWANYGRCLRHHYADFHGRASRSEFWRFMVLHHVLFVASFFISDGLFGLGYALLTALPSLSVTIRRLHDSGRSAWWCLVAFIPYVGWFVFLILLCLRGTQGANRYGEDSAANLARWR